MADCFIKDDCYIRIYQFIKGCKKSGQAIYNFVFFAAKFFLLIC